jgi:two-component system chemotaxis response regulator CheB
MAKIKVLVVDDSATVRQTLCDILNDDPEIEVMATATDPYVAARRLRDEVPDVITLDIEMPRMDGITFLTKLMQQHPLPVVICSSLTEAGSDTLLQALEAGAVEIITKPAMGTRQFLMESRIRICDAVKAAAQARLGRRQAPPPAAAATPVATKATTLSRTTDKLVCIGASTGGTEALRVVLQGLPADCPGVLVVQHMPERFTAAFANRLNGICAPSIKEAADGDPVLRGQVLIAPGNRHLLLKRSGARYYAEVKDGPLVSRHRPSVDVLFRSAARHAGGNAVGVIMTGMGDDGAKGLLEMREAGAVTVAQDEASCVVFGMPKEAIKLGAAERIVPLDGLAGEILRIYAGMSPLWRREECR